MASVFAISSNPDVVMERVGGVWADLPSQPSWGTSSSPAIMAGTNNDQCVVYGANLFWHWDGSSWTSKDDSIASGGVTCDRIFRLSDSIYYALCTYGVNLTLLKYSGGSWSTVVNWTNATQSAIGTGLYASSEDDIWVSGEHISADARLMHWNGSSWSDRMGEIGNRIPGAIFGFAADDIYFCHAELSGGSTQVSNWNGSTWTVVRSMSGNSIRGHGDIQGDGTSLWVLTSTISDGTLYIDRRSGGTWSNVLSLTTREYLECNRLAVASETEIYYGGQDVVTTGEVWQSDGTTWSQHADAILATREITAIATIEALVIDSVSESMIGQSGGVELTLTLVGTLTAGTIQIFLDGLPCYGGQGFGYLPLTTGVSGSTVKIFTPPSSAGVLNLTAQQGNLVSPGFPIIVLERSWSSKQFEMRKSFPPWYALGSRRLGEEDPL